ncbi:DUF421 domain-containing protein [Heliorestis acidaminivorans]|uniref:DUF421 domain-containing protein n=1 Tax=Heliorestis acidaminivorans TaxID=553427 RepID=A0A6I0EYI5_9FIRM|nr:DUF421 domain-containing protein [Heliorestis acidaminivorans]KAB2952380.1 DUF421 domain-containing protein [Heliorestis acidaminivorans]
MDIDVSGIIIRGFAAYTFLLIFTRMLGRQIISQMTLFDYVVGITIGSLAADMTLAGSDNFWDGLLALAVWIILPIVLGWVTLRSYKIRKVVEGEPSLIIVNGTVDKQALQRHRFNIDDLMSSLRSQGAFDIADIEFAILETDGRVSVLKKAQKAPLTPKDLNLATPYVGLPTTIMEDGNIIEHRLQEVKLSKEWLITQLRNRGIHDISEVFIAQIDTQGNLYVDLKKDGPK